MKRLLPASLGFLNHPPILPQPQSRPGTRQALKGMRALHGAEWHHYRRAMKDILRRHEKDIENKDEGLLLQQQPSSLEEQKMVQALTTLAEWPHRRPLFPRCQSCCP